LFFHHRPLCSLADIDISDQLDSARHLKVVEALLPVMAVLTLRAIDPAAPNDIALVVGFGIALVVVFAELQFGKHLPWSLQSQ
jgi:hypothetical protein